jgi:hypothetical protein
MQRNLCVCVCVCVYFQRAELMNKAVQEEVAEIEDRRRKKFLKVYITIVSNKKAITKHTNGIHPIKKNA